MQSIIEELRKAEEMEVEWIAVLLLAARKRKRVTIEYKYLDCMSRTTRLIEPIKWLTGRKGTHVLTYSPEDENWRRFALKNILNIQLTTDDYVSDYPVELIR